MINHIAIVMDGNRRWAKSNSVSIESAYKKGSESAMHSIDCCISNNIQYLSLFALSSDNLKRPKAELDILFSLFCDTMENNLDLIIEKNVNVSFVGKRNRMSHYILSAMQNLEDKTKCCSKLQLNVAIDYSGRSEIINACARAVEKCKRDNIDFKKEFFLSNFYFDEHIPDPDIFIRTGGEKRISDFMNWYISYSEIFFADEMWPDFDIECLTKVIHAFKNRERRFGF